MWTHGGDHIISQRAIVLPLQLLVTCTSASNGWMHTPETGLGTSKL